MQHKTNIIHIKTPTKRTGNIKSYTIDMAEVGVQPTNTDNTTKNQERETLEHELQDNWNGLLLNDFMNCDTSGAIGLWNAECYELDHPTGSLGSNPASLTAAHKVPSPR